MSANEVSAAPKWDEDQWIAACLHLIHCESQGDCRFCDRIKLQIKHEDERKEANHE